MKVLLLNPPYKPDFIRSARSTWPSISGSNWYPIFLAYATGWLEKHGHQAKLIDALVGGLSPREVFQAALDFQPELTAVYISKQSLKNDITISSKIKKLTGSVLVLVGPWCAANPGKILAENKVVDAIVPKEFDQVILDLAKGKPKKSIKGLVFWQNDQIITNPEAEFLTPKQLDQFPYVADIYKRHLPINKYYQASLLHPFVDLFTGRGCPWGKCTFCLWPNTIHKGASYRTRSLENVMAELKYIKKELPQVKEVFFQDDTLPAYRAREISERILKENLKLTWSCYSRADMDLNTLKLMKKAGCRYLHVGYESADEKVLKNICKGTTPAMMKKFTENTKKAGLKVHGDFILGLPGETEQTIKKTIKWAKDLGIEGYQFFAPQEHEGTPLANSHYHRLNQKKLNRWRFQAMREIYFSPSYFFNTLKNINSLDDLLRLIRASAYSLPKMLRNK